MKRICPTCKHETGVLRCSAKHIRWKNARFEIISVVNCLDWQKRNGRKEVTNEVDVQSDGGSSTTNVG